jgi:hypothetical protein
MPPKHSQEHIAEGIARTLATTHQGQPLDDVAMELRRRLSDAGLKPIGDDFVRLVMAVANGTAL